MAVSRASKGRRHTEQARQRMREARARRPGGVPGGPWTTEEDELVRTLPSHEVAWRTGRTPEAVYQRRIELGLARQRGRPWSAEEDELVRALSPAEVVHRTGRTLVAVWLRRSKLGVSRA